MDLLTQGLLGSTVAQAAYGNKIGRRAAFYGFVIGLLPDFDIISGYLGPWVSLKYHRGPTHSLIVLALLAIPVGWLCKKLSRSENPLQHWAGLAFLSLVTHPLIDWFTSYGTSLLWPFSNNRFALDGLPIIEPVYSAPLLFITIAGMAGLFSLKKMQRLAVFLLMFTTVYAFWGLANSQNLVKEGSQLFKARGFEPVAIRATPTLLNLFVFRVFARDKNNRFMITYLRKGSNKPLSPVVTLESVEDDYVRRALAHEHGQLFQWFSMGMLHTESLRLADGSHSVVLSDVRYGMLLAPGKSLFSAEATFNPAGELISFIRKQNHQSVSIKQELKATMAHVFGSGPGLADPACGAE